MLTGGRRAQLSNNEILQGLVMPAASYQLLGKGGAVLVIVICFMAVTSSGASEMVAVSSLFTFDIYRKYIHPRVRPKTRSDQGAHVSVLGWPANTANCIQKTVRY